MLAEATTYAERSAGSVAAAVLLALVLSVSPASRRIHRPKVVLLTLMSLLLLAFLRQAYQKLLG